MFRGRFEHNIDSKGRVSLPAKYREILSTNYNDRIVITNYDSCLIAYPYEEWISLEENFSRHARAIEKMGMALRGREHAGGLAIGLA